MEPNLKRPRIKNNRILSERIEKFISPLYFADVNLTSRLYQHVHKITKLLHYYSQERISFEEATQDIKKYQETTVGSSFGPTWSTHWFILDIDLSIDESWKNKEIRLQWNSGSEAMIWKNGKPMQGLTGGDGQTRTDYIVTGKCNGTERLTLYIEMAANGMFGAGKDGMINTPDPQRTFTLSMCQLVVKDKNISDILRDLEILLEMNKNLPKDSTIGNKALEVGCDVVNCFQPCTQSAVVSAQEILNKFFGASGRNKDSDYKIHAIGHCHIDTAWLWPYAETERKCARSWSSVIGLMKQYPDFKFACSQAVQFDWVKTKYPSLYEEVKDFVKAGRFLPIGGTWVEMDGNIPSGESFVRQFLYGQKFFKKEFGSYCNVFWLPDTFGYSAQLPQIIRQSGIKYFLTQKISWSLINKFPHNSFLWEGIDGSRCLTHFPPADTYESSVSFNDILKTETQNKDAGIVNDGMLLYGYGDGGGGPTDLMIERLNRNGNIQGLPSIHHSSPTEFFNTLEKSSSKLHTWVGELYLELHQGTFTTQALVKKRNRQCEMLLRTLEIFECWHLLTKGVFLNSIKKDSTEIMWKKVLLNQFHDVLPGSSIKQVFDDAHQLYEEVIKECNENIENYIKTIINKGARGIKEDLAIFNTCSWERTEVIPVDNNDISMSLTKEFQVLSDSQSLIRVHVPSVGFSTQQSLCTEKLDKSEYAYVTKLNNGCFEVGNNKMICLFNTMGQLSSCKLKGSIDNELICESRVGNEFCLYTDIPLFWDAWDVMPYNDETEKPLTNCTSIQILQNGPLRASLKFSLDISEDSKLSQVITLDAGADIIRFDTHVDWHENRKMLKVQFPLNVHNTMATYDIQYGYLQRPSHANTSWDWAKHEVCGHKWVDVSEYNLGIALLNDSKYGFSCYGNTLQMSLLRSSKAPDDQADMGTHEFSYALMPHRGSFQDSHVIQRAYEFNNPLRTMRCNKMTIGATCELSLFQVDAPNVILDAIKLAEDGTKSIVLRLYETFGSRSAVTVTSYYSFDQVVRTNLLEEIDQANNEVSIENDKIIRFPIKPFEIVTLSCRIK